MFAVDETTGRIEMNVGDTGDFFVDAERDDGEPFTADDRAVFTVNNAMGETVMERIYGLADTDLGNGTIHVELSNNDTDDWTPGSYTYEFRFACGPVWEGRAITSGDLVDTPGTDGKGNPIPMVLKPVQAHI